MTVPEPDSGSAAALPQATPERIAWEARGSELGRAASVSSWALGDWILQGEADFGCTYELAERITGLEQGTLRNTRYVAGRFQLSRRRDKLSFRHHTEVASLPPSDADALLARAEAEGLTAAQLRELATRRRPILALDPRAERFSAALKEAQATKKLITGLVEDEYVVAQEKLILRLEQLSAAPAELDGDRASTEDMKSGRFGRRV